ncbi:bleomycin resistance protein [Sphingobacterium sp. LRF_L2]|uniref:bleomycin resistance protein n=1 Tax=Sphingobacterium sp. LRF_L2 TaxID=3369421 RepID=UPI003F63B5BB
MSNLLKVIPKLPMRSKVATIGYYVEQLGFSRVGHHDYEGYLMLEKSGIELHFFEFVDLNPLDNYGQIYVRTDDIKDLYEEMNHNKVAIHPHGDLELKPWGQWEFSILDPDNNLITFGQSID